MKLGGRLTGHFLGRVALMIGGLGLLFLVWIVAFSALTIRANQSEAGVSTSQIVREAAKETTLAADGSVVLQPKLIADSQHAGIWVQVLDENGTEVTQTSRPAQVPTHYTPGKLVLYHQNPRSDGLRQASISTWAGKLGTRDLTWVAGLPGAPPSGPMVLINNRVNSPSANTFWLMLLALFLGGAVVTLGVAWLFGRNLSRPLVHMMAWLSALARGEFAEPVDRKGRPASRGADGLALRKPYSTYREVFGSLDTLTAELRSTAEERARIEAARDEWIASVSHDLRTPLTSVKGYAEMLASDYDFGAEDVRRQAGVIANQALHMDELLDDLNLSFRLRSDSLVLDRKPLDLIELVREAAVDLANDPRAADRVVLFDEPPGIGAVSVSADAKLLRRAIANLLVNAAIHNPAGTTIRASVAHEGPWAVVRVGDDGIGMDESTRSRLFDRYFRGTATGSAEGTGLGMAISRQIVVAHGGTIDVASALGAGTTAQIALPAL